MCFAPPSVVISGMTGWFGLVDDHDPLGTLFFISACAADGWPAFGAEAGAVSGSRGWATGR